MFYICSMEKEMTLNEYLNQEDPIRFPRVLVKENEIKRGTNYKGHTSIWIHGIFNEYLLEDETGHVYTIDSFGNKKKLSVFIVNKN